MADYEVKPLRIEDYPALETLVIDSYRALHGNGYARVDVRSNSDNPMEEKFFVLEVNSQVLLCILIYFQIRK